MEKNFFFNSEVLALLKKAGWFPSRDVTDTVKYPSDVDYPVDIRILLSEYGNLQVHSEGRGVNVARNSIIFDPSRADKESSDDGTIHYYSSLINTILYPLGYIPDENLFFCIDSDKKTYMVGDNLYWNGDFFVEGVSNILLGVSGRRLNEQDMYWMD